MDANTKALAMVRSTREIAERAEEAFWAEVAKRCPGAKSGDMLPALAASFSLACEQVVDDWRVWNEQGYAEARGAKVTP